MASASELWESRVGDVAADRNGFGATRVFLVTTDTVGQNPDDLLRDPDETNGVGGDAIPFKSPHPTRSGLQSAYYLVERRLTVYKYVVRVIYAPPIDFTGQQNPWELSYQGGLSSVIARHDWFGNPIGPGVYAKTLGPFPQGTSYFTTTVPGAKGKPPEEINLDRIHPAPQTDPEQPDNPVRKPIFLHDASRTEPVGSLTLSRTFPGMDIDTMANIALSSNTVNSTTFYGFPKRTVKFVGPIAHAGPGVIPETNTEGFIWRISLAFEYNSLGYLWEAQDMYVHDNGAKYPVLNPDGSPVIRSWQMYNEGNLYDLLNIVEHFGAILQAVNLGITGPRDGGSPTPIGGGR